VNDEHWVFVELYFLSLPIAIGMEKGRDEAKNVTWIAKLTDL